MKLDDIYIRCFNLDTDVDVYIFTSLEAFKKSKENKAVYKFNILKQERLGKLDVPAFKLAGFGLRGRKKLFSKIYIFDPKFDMKLISEM